MYLPPLRVVVINVNSSIKEFSNKKYGERGENEALVFNSISFLLY